MGDTSKAHAKLGWRPSTTFPELVSEMVREDLNLAQRDALIKQHGFAAFKHYYD